MGGSANLCRPMEFSMLLTCDAVRKTHNRGAFVIANNTIVHDRSQHLYCFESSALFMLTT